MKVSQLYPDKWLKAAHLQGRTITVYIQKSTVQELFNTQAKKKEAKFVLYFYKAKLPMVLNKTQAMAMVEVTGEDDSDNWKGHYIALSPSLAPNGEATITVSKPELERPSAPDADSPPSEAPEEETDENGDAGDGEAEAESSAWIKHGGRPDDDDPDYHG